MSFSSDITVADTTPASFTYSQISLVGSKSIRTDATRGVAYPRSMVISHQTVGTGAKILDRSLVRLSDVRVDTVAADGSSQTGSVYLVIEKPRRVITDAMINSMIDQLINFCSAGNRAKLFNGEP